MNIQATRILVLLFRVCLILPLLSMSPISGTQAQTAKQKSQTTIGYTQGFREDFDGTALDPNVWQVYTNGGLVDVDSGYVTLSKIGISNTFPYIHTKFSPIPPNGNFAVKIGVQYLEANPYGNGLSIDYELPANGALGSWAWQPSIYTLWQGSTFGFNLLDFSGSSLYYVPAPDLDYHEIEFRWLDDTDEYYIDSQLVSKEPRSSNVPRPVDIWFGNPVTADSIRAWTSFRIDYIEVYAIGESIPFLDLPFEYHNIARSLALLNWNDPGGGRINSWFDHEYPTYDPKPDNLLITSGSEYTIVNGFVKVNGVQLNCYGAVKREFCYNGHNGYDFKYIDPDPTTTIADPLPILAAGDGKVIEAKWGDYGNQIIIDHENGYFTFYGHLSRIDVIKDTYVIKGDEIGIMGSTGLNSDGTHLHFGVYRDDGDEIWEGDSVDKPTDPNGFKLDSPFGYLTDPWVAKGGPTSHWLWKFERLAETTADSAGGYFTDLSGDIEVSIPSGYFTEEVTLELLREPSIAAPLESLRSAGYSFWLRLKELLVSTQSQQNTLLATINQTAIAEPITVTVTYTDTATLHLNENELALFRWGEALEVWEPMTSTVDLENNIITAQSLELGHFELQAPLLCSGDEFIHDDSFYGAMQLLTDGSIEDRLFDVAADEDWFSFEATTGLSYIVQTGNLASGVDTVIDLYDIDGVTLLVSDDNSGEGLASNLDWQAPESGTYYIRVSQGADSVYGCSASYTISVKGDTFLFMPILVR